MKIFVIEPHTRTPGHFEEQAVGTCRAFVSLKNEVTLVTYGGISKDHAGETLPFVVADAAPNGAKNLEARRTKAKPEADSFRAFLRREIQEYRTFRLALALLDREETCIMHFYYGDPLLLFLTLNADLIFRGKRQTARPLVVLTIHEISRLDPSTDFRRRVFRWIFRQCLGRLIRHDLEGIAVFDPALRSEIIDRFKLNTETSERIRILPYGIEATTEWIGRPEARHRLSLDPVENIFLIFGVLRSEKRIDLAIEAIKGLRQCRLIIAGEARDFGEAKILDLAHKNGCEGSVTIQTGYISKQRMHEYFAASDAVMIPYAKSFRGLSAILPLAYSHGRCVIGTDVGQLGPAVREQRTGIVVAPDDFSELRRGIFAFLSLTAEEREQMERRALTIARRYRWDLICGAWVDFYRDLLDRRTLPS